MVLPKHVAAAICLSGFEFQLQHLLTSFFLSFPVCKMGIEAVGAVSRGCFEGSGRICRVLRMAPTVSEAPTNVSRSQPCGHGAAVIFPGLPTGSQTLRPGNLSSVLQLLRETWPLNSHCATPNPYSEVVKFASLQGSKTLGVQNPSTDWVNY